MLGAATRMPEKVGNGGGAADRGLWKQVADSIGCRTLSAQVFHELTLAAVRVSDSSTKAAGESSLGRTARWWQCIRPRC